MFKKILTELFRRDRATLKLGALMLLAPLTMAPECEVGDDDDDDEEEECGPTLAAIEDVCALERGPFSTNIDNPWFPLPVGKVSRLEGVEGTTPLAVLITVLDQTEDVGGVVTRVVEERETEDGELIEVSRNFFAQAPDGTVCYFGEDVDIYEAGEIVSHDGAWRAGGELLPGIIMPADPRPGMSYAQEIAPGIAEDHADHIAQNEEISVTAGTFTETLRTREWTPLEPNETSIKAYAHGVGLIIDDAIVLVSTTP
jgi:hypothetical protein